MDVAASALQSDFYGPYREEKAIRALDILSPHDLGALLKKLLRELPQPLLTAPLLDSFYHCHCKPSTIYFIKRFTLLTFLQHSPTPTKEKRR